MKKLIFSLLTCLFFNATSFAQLTVGWLTNDIFIDFQKTLDGGLIGNATPIGGGGTSLIKKYSGDGVLQFSLPYVSNQILPTSDGGYIIVIGGSTSQTGLSPYMGGYDTWVIKVSATGVIMWEKNLSGAGNDYATVKLTPNGSVIAMVSSSSSNGFETGSQGLIDIWLVQITSTGTLSKLNLGGSDNETLKTFELLSDTSFLVCITTTSHTGVFNQGYKGGLDTWVIKVSSGISLSITSKRAYGGSADDDANLIISNQKYLLAGHSKSSDGDLSINKGGKDIWICFTNQDGTLISSNNYGGTNDDFVKDAYFNTVDNAFYVLCDNNSLDGDFPNSNNRSVEDKLLKFSSTGNYVWRRDYFTNRYQSYPSYLNKNLGGIGVIITGTVFGTGSTNLFQFQATSQTVPTIFHCKINSNDGTTLWIKQPPFGSRGSSLTLIEQMADGSILASSNARGTSVGASRVFSISPSDASDNQLFFSDVCNFTGQICGTPSYTAKAGSDGGVFVQGEYYKAVRKVCPHPYQNISRITKYYCSSVISDTIQVPLDNEFNYQWKKNGVPIAGAVTNKYLANELGKYTVQISGKTCAGKAETDTIALLLNTTGVILPKLKALNDTSICHNDVVHFSLQDGCNYGYLQWQKNGADITGESSLVYNATELGTYRVKVTTNGNVAYTNNINVVRSSCCSMETVNSGDWENPMTWSCQRMPTSQDDIVINAGHQVIISTPNAVGNKIVNRGGNLILANITSRLSLTNE